MRQFPQLLHRVASGEEVTITRYGKPFAKLVPVAPAPERELGFLDIDVADDFFEPMREEDLELWN